jgi:sigma-E factor negative regulatory protein RseC
MTKFGRVTAYDGDKRTATIEFVRPSACEKCGACGPGAHKGSIVVQADCGVGDWVRLEFPEKRLLQAAVLAYGFPLLGFLGGLLLGLTLSGSDLGGALGACLGLMLALGLLRLGEKRIRSREDWAVRITGVYAENPSQEAIGCHGEVE